MHELFSAGLANCKDSKQIWSQVNMLTGRKRRPLTGSHDLEALNKSFVFECNPNKPQHLSMPVSESTAAFELDHVSTYRALKSLRHCAKGSDGLDPMMLKLCAPELTVPSTKLYQRCFNLPAIPKQWKSSQITPIPKADSEKFRPIASLPTLSKPLERIMLNCIQESLPNDPKQFAFTKNRSTMDSLAVLYNKIVSSLDKFGRAYRCCFLDFSSAFNTICRQRLLDCLATHSVDQKTMLLLKDFLSGRTQHCFLNGKRSSSIPNDFGVLQGSILSPTLFSAYVKGLDVLSADLFLKYADDFVIGQRLNHWQEPDEFQTLLSDFHTTSSDAQLYLNTEKCVEVIFTLKSSNRSSFYDNTPPLTLNDAPMNRHGSTTYLGVKLSSDLTWSEHVETIFRKLVRLSFYIKSLRICKLPQYVIERFVHACVIPIIVYCSPVIFPGFLARDFTLLRRGCRLISRVSCLEYSYITERIVNRHISSCKDFADRVLNDSTHPLHHTLTNQRSCRATRQSFRHVTTRTAAYKNSIIPYICRLLNNEKTIRADLLTKLSL